MDIKSAANGIIEYETSSGDQKVFKPLSQELFDAKDSYLFGKQSFLKEDYPIAGQWLREALNRTDNQTDSELMADILQQLSITEYKLKNFEESINLMNSSLDF